MNISPIGPSLSSSGRQCQLAYIQPVLDMWWSRQVIGWCQVVQRAMQTLRIILLHILTDQMPGFLKVCHGGDAYTLPFQGLVESFYLAIALRMVWPGPTMADVSLPQVGL